MAALCSCHQSTRHYNNVEPVDHNIGHFFSRHIVELLLTYEASCNSADEKGSSPLHLAAWAGFNDIVVLLLTHGPSIANVNLTVSILVNIAIFTQVWMRQLFGKNQNNNSGEEGE